MCARVQFQYEGRKVEIIIRPAPSSDKEDSPGVFDARIPFKDDDPYPSSKSVEKAGKEIQKLRDAAFSIQAKLAALMKANPKDPVTLYVQCEKGESRSPRCAAAFLKLHHKGTPTVADAVALVEKGYADPTDGCKQIFNKGLVMNWLSVL
jgi:hypothetical protein